ncbi:sugar dehydrogenase complex small subunit [Frateuria aurantia]
MSSNPENESGHLDGLNISRRKLILGISSASLWVAAETLWPGNSRATSVETAPEQPPSEFWVASQALTGVERLDHPLGQRIHTGLRQVTPGYDASLKQLAAWLAGGSLPASLAAASSASAEGKLASDLVRAWYLGIIGHGAGSYVVAYEHALMYAPLADVCVLPSFARGEPHYWARPPLSAGSAA